MARPAASTSRNVVSAFGALAGLTSTATRAASGTNSCRSSKRFATNSLLRKLMPVALPTWVVEAGDETSLDGIPA